MSERVGRGAAGTSARPRLLLATRSGGKLREMKALFAGSGVDLVSLTAFPEVPETPETGGTFEENARLKAAAAARATGLWALADDSGIEVAALAGAPGVRSARYAGEPRSDEANNERLLSELAGRSERRARFACVLALARPDGEVVETALGVCEGKLALAPRGRGGFGYDPLFVPEGSELTMAELPAAEKDSHSHRGRAARAMLLRLAAHGLGRS